MARLLAVLPKGEGFSPQKYGAIALCVRDFTLHSRFKESTLVLGGVKSDGFDDVAYRALPPGRWYQNKSRAYAQACIRVARQEGAALIEIHNRPQLVWPLARHTASALALHLHNDPQTMRASATPALRMQVLERCARVYCVSAFIRECFLEGLPDSAAQQVEVVHNGLELPRLPPRKEPIIVFAGRMTAEKGALLLARALALALPHLPSWRAVLIGGGRHEASRVPCPYEREVQAVLAPLGERVLQTGFLPHAATLDWFARAQIAAVPSLWPEPFGRTALEALAQGCAVLSSGSGALREVTGEAALTVEAQTPEAWAAALVRLGGAHDERAKLQARARVQALRFDIGMVTQRLDALRDATIKAHGDVSVGRKP